MGQEDDGAMEQAQESFQVLDEETRSHPFVMAVRLLHLKERRAITQQRGRLQENSEMETTETRSARSTRQRRLSSERRSPGGHQGTHLRGVAIIRAPYRR
jgi:hypothetical protein